MDVVRSAPQGAHYHADVICLPPELGIKKEQVPYGTPVPDQQPLYPDGQHTHAFYNKCVPPVLLSVRLRGDQCLRQYWEMIFCCSFGWAVFFWSSNSLPYLPMQRWSVNQ